MGAKLGIIILFFLCLLVLITAKQKPAKEAERVKVVKTDKRGKQDGTAADVDKTAKEEKEAADKKKNDKAKVYKKKVKDEKAPKHTKEEGKEEGVETKNPPEAKQPNTKPGKAAKDQKPKQKKQAKLVEQAEAKDEPSASDNKKQENVHANGVELNAELPTSDDLQVKLRAKEIKAEQKQQKKELKRRRKAAIIAEMAKVATANAETEGEEKPIETETTDTKNKVPAEDTQQKTEMVGRTYQRLLKKKPLTPEEYQLKQEQKRAKKYPWMSIEEFKQMQEQKQAFKQQKRILKQKFRQGICEAEGSTLGNGTCEWKKKGAEAVKTTQGLYYLVRANGEPAGTAKELKLLKVSVDGSPVFVLSEPPAADEPQHSPQSSGQASEGSLHGATDKDSVHSIPSG